MKPSLDLDSYQISGDFLIGQLHRFQLLPQLIQEITIDNLIKSTALARSIDLNYTSIEFAQKYAEIENLSAVRGMNDLQLKAICDRELRLQKFKLAQWGDKVESYFDAQGRGLDRVLLSILQVEDAIVAQELFFRIQSGEQSFAEIALDYSQDIYAQNGGSLGPVLWRKLSPNIRNVLEKLAPGQLSTPFKIDSYYTLCRIDEVELAQLDDLRYQFLLDELFFNWLKSHPVFQSGLLDRLIKTNSPNEFYGLLEKIQISPAHFIQHLSTSQVLPKYLHGAIVEESLEKWITSPDFHLNFNKVVKNIPQKDRRSAVFKMYKIREFDRLVRPKFLANKDRLDRVLFSIIQVKDLNLAQELYYRVTERTQLFTRLATTYSDSSTAKRGGAIGPISKVKLHPLIQHYLIGLKPQQLSPIFKLDEHYIFLRLDRSLPASYTPDLEEKLLDEIFDEWLQERIIDRIGNVYSSTID